MCNLLLIYGCNTCVLWGKFKPLTYFISSDIMSRNEVNPCFTAFIGYGF